MARKRVMLRAWRVSEATPSGSFVWFDSTREVVEIYELEPSEIRRVADALERDDQRGLFDEPDQVNDELVEDELPF